MLRAKAVAAARESLGRVNRADVGADKTTVRILISLTPVHIAHVQVFGVFLFVFFLDCPR